MMLRDYIEFRFDIKKYKYRKLTDIDLVVSIVVENITDMKPNI